MLERLRKEFPHIDWNEDERSFVSLRFVGALNEEFCIGIFVYNGDNLPYEAPPRYSALLRGTTNVPTSFAPVSSSTFPDPVEAVRALRDITTKQAEALRIFHRRFF